MPLTNLIAAAIEPLPQSVIDRCTVWTTPLVNDGRRYVYRFEAYDKDMLVKYAEERMAGVDKMRSPSLTKPTLRPDGLWEVELNYYGLE